MALEFSVSVLSIASVLKPNAELSLNNNDEGKALFLIKLLQIDLTLHVVGYFAFWVIEKNQMRNAKTTEDELLVRHVR
jgi:hypothetical protein